MKKGIIIEDKLREKSYHYRLARLIAQIADVERERPG
jgi:hypothetical protein